MPQMLRNLGYYTFGVGKMHWFPQKALHGFHTTLIDESGRVESKDLSVIIGNGFSFMRQVRIPI